MTALAPTLQAFFTGRLTRQRHASPQTIAAYRDTWRLLLAFTAGRTGRQPGQLDFADLDAPLIGAFLDHLEHDRGNSPRTRNARLAAIHSMFGYAALQHPEHAESISRVLTIPPRRFDRALVTWLTEEELDALLTAPDKSTIEYGTRRIRILGATEHPVLPWVVQQAGNLPMDLDDAGMSVKFVLHDRDASFTAAFDAVFQAAGARVVRSAIQAPERTRSWNAGSAAAGPDLDLEPAAPDDRAARVRGLL